MLIFVDILQKGRRKSLDISMKEKIIELYDKYVTQQPIACTLKINQCTVCKTISEYKKVILLLDISLAEEGKVLRIVVMSELSTE